MREVSFSPKGVLTSLVLELAVGEWSGLFIKRRTRSGSLVGELIQSMWKWSRSSEKRCCGDGWKDGGVEVSEQARDGETELSNLPPKSALS